MNEKMLDRISGLESFNEIFTIQTSDLNSAEEKVMEGSLLYPAIKLAYDDNSESIYNTITKNFYLMEKDTSILQKASLRYADLHRTVSQLNSFVDNYANQTSVMLSSLIDWANTYSGNYVFYDSMIYSSMVSRYNGMFNSDASFFYFGDDVVFKDYFKTSKMIISINDVNKVVSTNSEDAYYVKYSGTSKSKTLKIKITFNTDLLNYGLCFRCSKNYKYESKYVNYHDKFPLNLNYVEEYEIEGQLDGSIYYFDFTFIAHPFYQDGVNREYVTQQIDVSSITKSVSIENDYSSSFVTSFLIKEVDGNKYESLKPISSGVSSLIELIDGDYKFDYVNGITSVKNILVLDNEHGYNIPGFIFDKSLYSNSFERILYGQNCVKKTNTKKEFVNTLEINGQYTFKIDKLFTDKINDVIDIPVTIKQELETSKVSMNILGIERSVTTFSVFGKTSQVYLSENQIYYKSAGDSSKIEDIFSGKKLYHISYDPLLNITTFYTLENDVPTDITYTTSIFELITKNNFTITSANISTDYTFHNYNFFGSQPENSMFLISPNGFIKNENLTDIPNVYQHLVDNNISYLQLSMNINLENKYIYDVTTCSIYVKEGMNISIPLNSGSDILTKKSFLMNGVNVSFLTVERGETITLEFTGDILFVNSKMKNLITQKDLIVYSGILMDYSREETSMDKFRVSKIGNDNYLLVRYNFSYDVSPKGSLIPLKEVSYAPFVALYKERSFSPDIKYILRLVCGYNGYVMNKIRIFGI